MPMSSMFSAPASRELVCGATIESCHDQSDTSRTGGGALSARLSSASQALPGRICPRQTPGKSHACTLPWCGAPSVINVAILSAPWRRRYARATIPPMLWPTMATRAAPVARRIAVDLRCDLVREGVDRGQRRAVRQRVHGSDPPRSEVRTQTPPDARVAEHAVQQQDRRRRARGLRIADQPAVERHPRAVPGNRAELGPEQARARRDPDARVRRARRAKYPGKRKPARGDRRQDRRIRQQRATDVPPRIGAAGDGEARPDDVCGDAAAHQHPKRDCGRHGGR